MAADQSAEAAQIDAVTGAKITNTSTPAGPNYVYDNFKLELTFDTTGKTVAENDTLNIQLPSELRTRSASFDVTDTESGDVALRCTVPAAEGPEVTCVFTDFMATHVNARGNIVLVADSVKETTSEVLHATINHSVDIPMHLDHGQLSRTQEVSPRRRRISTGGSFTTGTPSASPGRSTFLSAVLVKTPSSLMTLLIPHMVATVFSMMRAVRMPGSAPTF